MKFEIKPFDESTLEDFKEVVRNRFSEATTALADKVLANPVRRSCADSGAVGYADGNPVCIRASIIRKIYFRQEPFFGIVGGMLAKKHGADRGLLKAVVKESVLPRDDSRIFFTNTSVNACVKLNKEAGVAGQGPDHWNFRRVAVFHPFLSKWIRFSSVHPRVPKPKFNDFQLSHESFVRDLSNGLSLNRELRLRNAEIDDFWSRYLSGNGGLVASRTAAEIDWAYGDRLANNVVFFSLRNHGELVGYIVASFKGRGGVMWKVIDWIAQDNDLKYLELLLRGIVDYVRRNTPAVAFSISGFPGYVQPIIAKYFKHKDCIGHNPYLFHCYDSALLKAILDPQYAQRSWFWGPYDGDMCME